MPQYMNAKPGRSLSGMNQVRQMAEQTSMQIRETQHCASEKSMQIAETQHPASAVSSSSMALSSQHPASEVLSDCGASNGEWCSRSAHHTNADPEVSTACFPLGPAHLTNTRQEIPSLRPAHHTNADPEIPRDSCCLKDRISSSSTDDLDHINQPYDEEVPRKYEVTINFTPRSGLGLLLRKATGRLIV